MNNFDFSSLKDLEKETDSKHHARWGADTCDKNGHRKEYYTHTLAAFDIETSLIDTGKDHPEAAMYIWMFALEDRVTLFGRTWEQFQDCLTRINDNLPSKQVLIVWVHNLAYEWQFMRWFFDWQKVFLVGKRKPITARWQNIEFRCSYKQTNMSLDAFTHKMGAKHSKLSGDDFDYKAKRYPWTELSFSQLNYCENDVVGLIEAMRIQMEKDGDSLYSIPLTSTGYVRRDVRKAVAYFQQYLKPLYPNEDLYRILKDAFRGGDVHANPAYSGKVLKNVKSVDKSSAYPSVQCIEKFPVSSFKLRENVTFEQMEKLLFVHKKALVFRIRFTKLFSKDPFPPEPYLSFAKVKVTGERVLDNGRVVCANSLETALTDIDYKIVKDNYTWESAEILELWDATYGILPKGLVKVVQEYYKAKTALKGVEGQEYFYMKSKNKLNAIYGMSAQDPYIDNWQYKENEYVQEDDGRLQKTVLPYQFGVWTTARTRESLRYAIDIVGKDFVYCDTDSVKYIGKHSFSRLNKEIVKKCKVNESYADDKNGKRHYMGVFENEEPYDNFITLGAKKYAYEKHGVLGITCAGVSTKKLPVEQQTERIKTYAAKELQSLDNFQSGFEFTLAGKNIVVYHDHMPEYREIDGHTILVPGNAAILDGEYTISIAKAYADYLTQINYLLE